MYLGSSTSASMDRCTGRLKIRGDLSAGGHVHAPDSRLRGLPLPERIHHGRRAEEQTRRDGVAVRRQLH